MKVIGLACTLVVILGFYPKNIGAFVLYHQFEDDQVSYCDDDDISVRTNPTNSNWFDDIWFDDIENETTDDEFHNNDDVVISSEEKEIVELNDFLRNLEDNFHGFENELPVALPDPANTGWDQDVEEISRQQHQVHDANGMHGRNEGIPGEDVKMAVTVQDVLQDVERYVDYLDEMLNTLQLDHPQQQAYRPMEEDLQDADASRITTQELWE